MVESAPQKGTCGECKHFDVKAVDGNHFGFSRASNVWEGVCRANKGLTLGVRTEESNCLQPLGTFEKRHEKQQDLLNPLPECC